MLVKVQESLKTNNNLTPEVKKDIYDLITIFNNNFKEIDLTNLINKLKTLQIKKISKFLNQDVSMYNNNENTIYFNISEMNKGYDMKHVLMFELLNVITSSEYSTGFNDNYKFEALNIGYTEILANYLVGNDSDKLLFKDEAIEANIISTIIGTDNIKNAYFNNDSKIITESFKRLGVEF